MHDEMMNRPDDHEAKMARADLFKLAQYSFKLFKMISEDQELEGWVQAKITKAADYIASVYHYMEYEMKISEYGDHLENKEMYSESIRRVFAQKLEEAKAKAAAIREDEMKVGDTKKTRTGELTKTSTGVVHKRTDYSDEEHGEAPSTVKQKSAAEKKADKEKEIKLPKHKGNTWGMKGGEKFGKKMEGTMAPMEPDGATAPPPKGKDGKYPVITSGPNKGKRWTPQAPGPTNPALKEANKSKKDYDGDGKVESPKDEVWGSRAKAAAKAGKPFKESAKPDFLDMDKDGDKEEPMKKAVKDKKVKEASSKCNHTPKGEKCPVHGLKECGGMYEAKPSAGMSKGEKSAVVKKAKAGGDIGKPGKSFDKVAKAAGGGEKGKKIAAAAMWKSQAKKKIGEGVLDNMRIDELDVKLYQPHEYEFRSSGAAYNDPEVEKIIKMMKPSDYLEKNKFDKENPPKSNETPDERQRMVRLAVAAQERDEYNFVQRWNRDHNNLSIAQWLEKAKNKIKGALTGKPAEPVSYQSSRGDPGNTSFEKEFPKYESVNESVEIDRLKELTKKLLG